MGYDPEEDWLIIPCASSINPVCASSLRVALTPLAETACKNARFLQLSNIHDELARIDKAIKQQLNIVSSLDSSFNLRCQQQIQIIT